MDGISQDWPIARMHEFEDLHDLDRVGQGDVLKWGDIELVRPWQCFGVVVTADCDLAHEKHGGVISYVPAMLTHDFIWEAWRPQRIGSKLEELLVRASQRIGRWLAKNGATALGPSPAAIRRWLERSGPEEILNDLGVTDRGERNVLLNVLNPVESVLKVVNCSEPNFERLAAAYAIVNPKAASDSSILTQDIQKSWGALPGDVFHLPSMPGADHQAGQGLFLHLRHIRQIKADEVSARPDDLRTGRAKAARVARVSAPYRYAITQALARVFSDIGLPDEHDERRKRAALAFFQGMTA